MMQAQRVENKENSVATNAVKAEVAATVSKQPFSGNLMVMTQNTKTRVEDRKNAEGVIKPENDPFWNERCAEKDARLAANPASAAIRAHAVSKLLQPTSAYLSGARKKADEAATQKVLEDKAKAAAAQRVPVIPAECGLLRPTTAYRQHKTTAPEPCEPSDEMVARTLNEFGSMKTFSRRGGGTIGFGMASDAVLPAAADTMELPGQAAKKELTQPVVSQRLLVPTSASRAATYAKHKEETVKKFRTWTTPVKRPAAVMEAASRVSNLAAPLFRLTAQAEAMRTDTQDAAGTKTAPAAPRERGWNSVTCNAKSLDRAYVRANPVCSENSQQVPITGAVAPIRTTFTPTVFHAFSVADKPTAAAAMRSRGGLASTVAEQLMAANEQSLAQQMSIHRAAPSSRASLGGFSNVMRPTAASMSNVANRRSSLLLAPPAPMAVQMQAVQAKPEIVAQAMPPTPPVEVVNKKMVIKVESPKKAPATPAEAAAAVQIKEEDQTAIPTVDGDELIMTAEEASLYADIVASTMASLTASRASRVSKSPSLKKIPIKSPKSVRKATPKASASPKAAAMGFAKRTPVKCTATPGKSPVVKSAKKSPKSAAKSPKTPKSAKRSTPRTSTSPASTSTPKAGAKTPKSARKTLVSTPMAVPSPPSPLSAPGTAPRTATRMSASKSANNSKMDVSAHVLSLTQDVAALLVDSPHVARSASGAAITPPTRGQVPAFDESPLTPAEIKRSTRRVTRSLAALPQNDEA